MPKDCINTIKEFSNTFSLKYKSIDLGQIVNMGEKNIYVDSSNNYTYDKRVSNRVKATISGNERTRQSAAFSAAANGTKLPIFIILPRLNWIRLQYSI